MHLVVHRRNTTSELLATPSEYGVEIDLRIVGGELVLQHDPFTPGERFDDWLLHYRHGTLILNVKEEGLEAAVLRSLERRAITNFFFLDQSFPFLLRWARAGERRCAVRVSEYESIETALRLSGLIDWVWVDCFSRFPLTAVDARLLSAAGFKLCLVSPELQGRMQAEEILALRRSLKREGIEPEAVCTKFPERWLP